MSMINWVRQLWKHLAHEDLTLIAAALSYSTLLSFIPFFAVTLSALNYFDALDSLTPKVESFLLENLNGAAGQEGIALVQKGIQRVQNGRMGSLGALILILVSTRMMIGLERGYHRIWQIRNRRPLVHRLFYHWMFLLTFPFGLAVWVAYVSKWSQTFESVLPVKIGFGLVFLVLFLFQIWLPSQPVKWGPAFLGAGFSTLGLFILEKGFKILTVRVFSYGKIYGSFAAIPASMLWLFLVWLVILWGVGVSASLQKSRSET